MRIIVAALFAAALLMLSACSEKTEELSTTDPTGTLPFPSDAGPRDPSPPDLPPPTTAVAAPETSGDDSGFDADTTRTGRDVPAPGTDAPTATDGTGSRP
ncbi:MAG TPA: hypothetical protein VF432_00010 [Thermoanaerobaculia bacterium]